METSFRAVMSIKDVEVFKTRYIDLFITKQTFSRLFPLQTMGDIRW